MLDRIQEIDTGAIEELTRIKRDQEVLEDRLRLMVERREGVSEAVFERVRGDYRSRLDGLDREAQPLKEGARREYAKLRAIRDELQQARDEAQLEKEEVEFRNSLGEFAAEEYERRSTECAERVAAREGELTEVEALRERFLGSCRSADELEVPAAATPAEAPPGVPPAGAETVPPPPPAGEPALEEPVAPPPVEASAAEPTALLVGDQQAAAEAPPPAPLYYGSFDAGKTHLLDTDEGDDEDGTLVNAREADEDRTELHETGASEEDEWHEAPTGSFDVPPLPAMAATEEVQADDDELSGATRILARPRFVEMENGLAGREHALGLGRTSIGRASDNQVHLLDEAVSRHHAEVVPGPKGYLLRDLGSENGIFVNGDRAPEHVLRDGDIVQIGARTLVFHGA